MSMDVDAIVDRRRLRRKLTLWRIVAILAVIVGIGGIIYAGGGTKFVAQSSPHVARVTVGGLIRNDRDRLEMLDNIAKSGAKAVIISIDSPGGTVAGSEALYDGIRRLAAKKPVVAVVEGISASGAYIVALGTDRIFAPRNAIIGSIGVIFQYPNVTDLLKHIGVTVEDIKSTPLKAAPNGYEPTSPEAKAAIRGLVEDSYGWFKGLVRERRGLDETKLAVAADGRVFTANQALPLNLIDEIGDERAARDWLAKNKNVDASLPIRDWKGKQIGSEFNWLAAPAWLANKLGLPALASLLSRDAIVEAASRAQLDGLLALWQPPSTN
ncbi:MAG TPA: signal peptide peptidase SppA [Xanthobacteraceae bacterium]|nr:signal peptide peptidase SppA [Xanthobacteraceae bacterium]